MTRQASGGNPGAFRFMSHRLPPVTGEALATVAVTHLYLTERYRPPLDGEIRAIDYREDGIILSFPFAEAFSTTQPVIEQGGRLFRATNFIRFIAQNSSSTWETKSLNQLTADDFVAVDGSGDHPDFRVSGGSIRFGFTRSNSRGSTQPPVPGDQDMVIDQGVDNWRIVIYRDDTNRPPNAVDDTFVLDGDNRSLPLLEFFDVLGNDSDPNLDRLEVVEVTEPFYGSAGSLTGRTIVYQLDEARASDSFGYTVSDGALTGSAQVEVYIDCACTALCLSSLELPEPPGLALTQADIRADEEIDLPLIYRVRDQVLRPTLDGRRYIEMYYTANPEILVQTFTNETLRTAALDGVLLWQEPLRSLVDGDGRAVITQARVDALESYLDQLSDVAGPPLQRRIATERSRLGPLEDYVGMSMSDAKRRAIGDPAVYLPLVRLAP
ncbi:MAG: hypothetical protein IT329_21490 [Caldilineaceae bacterium]|nr:hypothetical protein [Caldilineaceae bacterium]